MLEVQAYVAYAFECPHCGLESYLRTYDFKLIDYNSCVKRFAKKLTCSRCKNELIIYRD